MIEDLIKELIIALRENTAAHTQATPEPAPKRKTKAKAATPAAPEPTAPAAEEPTTPAAPEPTAPATEEPTAPATEEPTKVEVKAAKVTDTPHVAGVQHPDQPIAGEYVDVDEVIAQINSLVKSKLQSADDIEAVKTKWTTIREGYGVDRISDLKGEPAKLLEALAAAKVL